MVHVVVAQSRLGLINYLLLKDLSLWRIDCISHLIWKWIQTDMNAPQSTFAIGELKQCQTQFLFARKASYLTAPFRCNINYKIMVAV